MTRAGEAGMSVDTPNFESPSASLQHSRSHGPRVDMCNVFVWVMLAVTGLVGF